MIKIKRRLTPKNAGIARHVRYHGRDFFFSGWLSDTIGPLASTPLRSGTERSSLALPLIFAIFFAVVFVADGAAQAESGAGGARPQIPGGTVLSVEEMGAELKKDGQKQQMIFGQFAIDESRELEDILFNRTTLLTASEDRAVWYLLSGDEALGDQSTELGVDFAGVDLVIYDPTRTELPSIKDHSFNKRGALRDMVAVNRVLTERAQEESFFDGLEDFEYQRQKPFSERQKAGYVRFYNDYIEELFETSNVRVVMEGRVINVNTGEPTGWLTFLEEPGDDFMSMIRTTESGASYLVNFGFDRSYFPSMEEAISQAQDNESAD